MDSELLKIYDFLSAPLVSSLLSIHPNDVCLPDFAVPPSWISWWNWAGEVDSASDQPKWLALVRYYVSEQISMTGAEICDSGTFKDEVSHL